MSNVREQAATACEHSPSVLGRKSVRSLAQQLATPSDTAFPFIPASTWVTRGASVPRLPLSATHEEASLRLESLCLPSASEIGRDVSSSPSLSAPHGRHVVNMMQTFISILLGNHAEKMALAVVALQEADVAL
ncbi:uncharacterized protein [Penaeus vannamei]|uniref:uncharacterized protein n=1 Tax=Penaeus vannamei TaxID=6689 RepID=UPI00387F63BD